MKQESNSFKIYRITDRVYLFFYDKMYDLCMHFLRYQEFYESPKFNNRSFTIIEFMEWYANTYGDGVFTYTKDWSGFNIPSNVIWKVHSGVVSDFNKYDAAMLAAYNKISSITHLVKNGTRNDTFYVLGACKDDIKVLVHELAHGLYFTDPAYRASMTEQQRHLPGAAVKEIFEYFSKIGYHESVLDDELQAYLATGLPSELSKLNKYAKPFEKVFKQFTKSIDFDIKSAQPLQFK